MSLIVSKTRFITLTTFFRGYHTMLHKLEWLKNDIFLGRNFEALIINISSHMHMCKESRVEWWLTDSRIMTNLKINIKSSIAG